MEDITRIAIPSLRPPVGREGVRHPSLNPGDMRCAAVKPRQVYTGTNMIGVATMHKSNAVPVFTTEEAESLSAMRR